MGMMENAKEVAGKLKLGPHHTIERFGVIFTAISAVFLILVGSTAFSAWNSNRADLSAAALYSEGFTTSLTQQSGEVEGVYVSEDGRRALLMMELSGGSGAEEQVWSANAENYQAFLGGMSPNQTPAALNSTIDGNIVNFGSTGYMGVVLTADEPFPENPQILSLTMRNNAELVAGQEPSPELSGTSFAEFDQWRLFFNPGATEATTISALNGSGIDAEAIYAEVLLVDDEAEIQADLDASLQAMESDLRLINEYENELERLVAEGQQVVLPELPTAIAEVERLREEGVTPADIISGEPMRLENEEIVQPSTLSLNSDWVDPRGWDLSWQDTSVSQGFLGELVPSNETVFSYMANKASGIPTGDAADAKTEEDQFGERRNEYNPTDDFDADDIEWILTDGTDLADRNTDSPALAPLRDLMNSLSERYKSYYDNKVDYQVDHQGALLDLELQLTTVESSYSVNTNEDALQTY